MSARTAALNAVVFDLETTGLSPERDGIVELGALKIVDGHVVEAVETEFQTLIRPENVYGETLSIPERSRCIHGISNDMVAGAPLIGEVLPEFLAWAEDLPVVAHNIGFDMGFMRAAARRGGLSWRPPAEICTVRLSRRAFPHERRHNLDALAQRLGLSVGEGEQRHRSMADVRLTAAAYLQLVELLGQ